MRYIKPWKLWESTISKAELVDKIKYYSNWVKTYVKDVNKFTTSNLNLGFSYDTVLGMMQIFQVADALDHDSSDGLISAVAEQFIIWSEYFTESKWHGRRFKEELEKFQFDYNYENYTDEDKKELMRKLYDQRYTHMVYGYVGQKIKQLISGTIWDIPEKKLFTDEDKEFIIDCLITEYDVDKNYTDLASDMIDTYKTRDNSKGVILHLPIIGDRWNHEKLTYESEFILRLQSYFGAVFLLEGKWGEYYKIYLPFYV